MKDLMKTNCYDIGDTLVVVGSCLESMQPNAFKELEGMSDELYEVCLENTHVNMVITKLIGMLSRVNVKKVIFASVDKSPHCIQLHYMDQEISKAMKDVGTEFVHYVAVDDKLKKIDIEVIKKSKSLSELQDIL